MEADLNQNPTPEITPPITETPQVLETPPAPEIPSTPVEQDFFGKHFQTAQVILFGIMTASFVYSIYYYKKKLDNDPIIALKKETEQIKYNLQKLMGSDYENN